MIEQVDHVIIVDNFSTDGSIEYLKNLSSEKTGIIFNDKNYGIAYALNKGIEFAQAKGYSWILTMDQDSSISHGMINKMIDVYNKHLNKEKIASLSPKIIYDNKFVQIDNIREYHEEIAVITSGSLVKIDVIKEVGGFEEKLFIDSVDFDFCLKLKKFKYKVIVCNTATMLHLLGENKKVKLFNRELNIHTHSLTRKYYISRNHVYIIKKYIIQEPLFCLKKGIFFTLFFLQVIIYEKERLKNLRIIFRGLLDGILGRYGRLKLL